jgi:hypothetical protein
VHDGLLDDVGLATVDRLLGEEGPTRAALTHLRAGVCRLREWLDNEPPTAPARKHHSGAGSPSGRR